MFSQSSNLYFRVQLSSFYQKYSTLLLETHYPSEFNSNPNHLNQLIQVLKTS